MKSGILLIGLVCASLSMWAHDPTDFTYDLNKDELTIHLTPKGVLDLITTIHPELGDQSSIKLMDYITDYSIYFNKHIALKSNGENIGLDYMSADLSKHDSWIRFKLSPINNRLEVFDIEISAFEDVYKNVQNTIVANGVYTQQASLQSNYNYAGILLIFGVLIFLWPSKYRLGYFIA